MFEFDDLPPPDEQPATERIDGLPASEAPSGRLRFVRRRGIYQSETPLRLKNNLLMSVGLLELANAGDFAANVWNKNPLPIYAIFLMAVGGTVALSMIYFVVSDGLLSWRNVRGLRVERQFLKGQRPRYNRNPRMLRTIDCFLDVNLREIGTEVIDRVGMDILMGFGALVVGVGTYLAIGGDRPRIFLASNLLTGYIGNSPCALYGLVNFLWSVCIWRRAMRHKAALPPGLNGSRVERMLQMRAYSVQLHSALNGITCLVAGAASLATATMWWGYVVLGPCIVTSFLVNIFWRHRIGYDRPYVRDLVTMDEDTLLDALAYVDSCHRRVLRSPTEVLSVLVSNPRSLSSVLELIAENQLFEAFCLRVLRDAELTAALFPGADETLTINWRRLAATPDQALVDRLLQIANDMFREAAPVCFQYQERYLLEALGAYMCITQSKREVKKEQSAAAHRPCNAHRNAHTYSGRHTNEWLFGDFSFTATLRKWLCGY